MKMIFTFILFLSTSAFAAIDAQNFKILPGKFHQGGSCSSEILSTDSAKGVMAVKLKYEVIKRGLVPAPNEYLKGAHDQDLPLDFIDERGYLELEKTGTRKVPEALIKHMGRVKVKGMSGGHMVRILPDNGDSEMDIVYHPHLPELGWSKVKLTIHTKIPMLKSYTMEAVLID